MTIRRVTRFLQSPRQHQIAQIKLHLKHIWTVLALDLPLPIPLPHGLWWLARDDRCSDEILLGRFETSERRFVERSLRPGMTFLDIGAHNGFYSLLAAKLVESHGTVVAFEPSPRERKRLEANMRLNRLKNVQIVDAALGAKDGRELLFVVDGYETGLNSMRPPVDAQTLKSVQVPTMRLDTFIEQRHPQRIDFVKIDAEGAELDVFKGAHTMLERRPRPVILCEVDDLRSEPWGHSAADVLNFLEQQGFVWFGIGETGELAPVASRASYNLVAIPAERFGDFPELASLPTVQHVAAVT